MSENRPARSPVAMAVLLVLHAVYGIAILWLLLRVVPQYEKIFKDFNLKLPEMTLMVIGLSRLFGMYWFVFVPGLAAIDFGIVFALYRTGHTRLMMVWGVLTLLAAMLLAGLIQMAVLVPLDDLMIRISGGRK